MAPFARLTEWSLHRRLEGVEPADLMLETDWPCRLVRRICPSSACNCFEVIFPVPEVEGFSAVVQGLGGDLPNF